MDFAQKSKALSGMFPDAKNIEVFVDMVGEVSNIRWMIDYPDLATFEKVHKAVMANTDYWKFVGDYEDAFVQAKVEDLLLTSI
jgi:hypothetical protein